MKKKVSAIRSFFKFLLKRQIIDRNPASGLRSPKVGKSLPRFLTVDQAFRVMGSPPKEVERAKPLRVRDLALLETLYGTGARVGELASMNLEHCDLTESVVRVLGKGGKERVVPVLPPVASLPPVAVELPVPVRPPDVVTPPEPV